MRYIRFFTISFLSLWQVSFASEFNDAVDSIFSFIDESNSPGCSVGVVSEGQLIHKAGYGLANLELNVALDGDDVHRMASVSKQFTAMAVLLLAEEQKIDLEEDIRTYLPDLVDYGSKVTINSMLGHVSGMANYGALYGGEGIDLKSVAGGPFRMGNEDYLSISEFYDQVKNVRLEFPPNQQYEYSNLAYFLLSMLVEEVSGETLREYANSRIFQSLGMNDTFFSDDSTEIVRNRASGYKPTEDGYVIDMTNLFWVGEGGLHTTIEDMLKWDQNFYNSRIGIQPARLLELYNSPNSDITTPGGGVYANGQVVMEINGRERYSHGGVWLGTRTHYARFPDDQFSTFIMCNDASLVPGEYALKIADLYFEND